MLMNVVLPAPLVPVSPTTESFSTAALTSFAAVTAPKLLQSPRAFRITATSGLPPFQPAEEAFGEKDDQHEQGDAERHLPGVRREVVRRGADRAVEPRGGERRYITAPARGDGHEDELC